MAEIPFIPITSVPPQQLGTGNGGLNPASVLSIPPQVANQPVGALINALVAAADPNGNIVLTTPGGQLTVAPRVDLPIDTRLVLQVSANNINAQGQNTGNIFQAKILTINGNEFNAQNLQTLQNQAAANPALSSSASTIPVTTLTEPAAPAAAAVPPLVTTVQGQLATPLGNVVPNAQAIPLANPDLAKAPGGRGVSPPDNAIKEPQPVANITVVSENLQENGFDILRAVPLPRNAAGQAAQVQVTQNPVSINSHFSDITHGETLQAVVITPAADAAKYLSPKLNINLPETIAQVQSGAAAAAQNVSGQPVIASLLKASDTITLKIINAEFPQNPSGQVNQAGDINQTPPGVNTLQGGAALDNARAGTGANNALSGLAGRNPDQPLPEVSAASIVNGRIPGLVIASENNGEPIVKTPLGNIRLPLEATLPKGTALELQLISVDASSGFSSTDEQSRLLSSARADFSEVIDVLKANDPAAANKVLAGLPQSDNLPTKLFSFLTTFAGNSANPYLPAEARKVLEKAGREDLIDKIGKDFSMARQLAGNNPSSWNSMLFPMFDGKELQFGMFHYRREKGEGDDGKPAPDKVRFMVELNLTRLGSMEMQGEVLNHSKTEREFNLTVKTRSRLANDVQKGISDIFLDASEVTGNKGMLQFVVDRDSSVSPAFQAPPATDPNNFMA